MFYTDELHRLKPLAWVAVTSLGFWALTFWKLPVWSFLILAAVTGITAAALPVIGRWWWMRDLEKRYPEYASDDWYEWINRITRPRL